MSPVATELSAAAAVKTPRTARTTAALKTEPGLVNALVDEDNNTTASNGVTFAKFRDYKMYTRNPNNQADFTLFNIHDAVNLVFPSKLKFSYASALKRGTTSTPR